MGLTVFLTPMVSEQPGKDLGMDNRDTQAVPLPRLCGWWLLGRKTPNKRGRCPWQVLSLLVFILKSPFVAVPCPWACSLHPVPYTRCQGGPGELLA